MAESKKPYSKVELEKRVDELQSAFVIMFIFTMTAVGLAIYAFLR